MIKFLEAGLDFYEWEINGISFRQVRKANISVNQNRERIMDFYKMLYEKQYMNNLQIVIELYKHFGAAAFIRLGMEIFQNEFLTMYRYYCLKFFASCYENFDIVRKPTVADVMVFMVGEDKIKHHNNIYMPFMLEKGYKDILVNWTADIYLNFYKQKVISAIETETEIAQVFKKIGTIRFTLICMEYIPEQVETYVQSVAEEFTNRREFISRRSLLYRIFKSDSCFSFSKQRWDKRFCEMVNSIVNRELERQKTRFINENYREMDPRKDKWIIYYRYGGNIRFCIHDFNLIHCPALRLEVKYYMIFRLVHDTRGVHGIVTNIAKALNIITKKNKSIRFAADISETEVKALYMHMETSNISMTGKKMSLLTISAIFYECSNFFNYLTGNMRSCEIKSPIPRYNPFKSIKFVNRIDYPQRTEIIPECVLDKLDEHIDEIPEIYALLYKIAINTGMRSKEIVFLESDCIEPSIYENMYQIKYIPYKVLSSRRRAGLDDYHRILIFNDLAEKIKDYAKQTEDLRQKSGLPYLFLSRRVHNGVIDFRSVINAINALLKKYNICDESGIPWNFTVMQCRKTLAVTLIENGATETELSFWLGHLNSRTSMNYYAEVRKMKLAELNTEFFKKQFELQISPEQLECFSEDERKLLYIDFRLGKHRVEFGFCLRDPALGGCDRRANLYNCINCRHLCTGKQYLSYWKELLDDSEEYVNGLIASYQKAGVKKYHDFKEYTQALFLRDCYKSIVGKILGQEVNV